MAARSFVSAVNRSLLLQIRISRMAQLVSHAARQPPCSIDSQPELWKGQRGQEPPPRLESGNPRSRLRLDASQIPLPRQAVEAQLRFNFSLEGHAAGRR